MGFMLVVLAERAGRFIYPPWPAGSTDGRFGRTLQGPTAVLWLRQHARVLAADAEAVQH